jgi:hypothetical protein
MAGPEPGFTQLIEDCAVFFVLNWSATLEESSKEHWAPTTFMLVDAVCAVCGLAYDRHHASNCFKFYDGEAFGD